MPPFPNLADASRSLRGWWWRGAENFCWQKGDGGRGRQPSLVLHEDGPSSQMKTLAGGCGWLSSRSHGSIISASVSVEPLFIRLIFNLFYLFICQKQNSWAVLFAVFWGHREFYPEMTPYGVVLPTWHSYSYIAHILLPPVIGLQEVSEFITSILFLHCSDPSKHFNASISCHIIGWLTICFKKHLSTSVLYSAVAYSQR